MILARDPRRVGENCLGEEVWSVWVEITGVPEGTYNLIHGPVTFDRHRGAWILSGWSHHRNELRAEGVGARELERIREKVVDAATLVLPGRHG